MRRGARTAGGAVATCLLLLTAACSGGGVLPARAPDVTGTVALRADGPVLADASDAYFEGMSLGSVQDTAVVRGRDQVAAGVDELEDGEPVRVWIGGGCRESSPVQCDVVALHVAP